jgi:hypothetical protein
MNNKTTTITLVDRLYKKSKVLNRLIPKFIFALQGFLNDYWWCSWMHISLGEYLQYSVFVKSHTDSSRNLWNQLQNVTWQTIKFKSKFVLKKKIFVCRERPSRLYTKVIRSLTEAERCFAWQNSVWQQKDIECILRHKTYFFAESLVKAK